MEKKDYLKYLCDDIQNRRGCMNTPVPMFIIVLVLCLCGCRTTEYVPVETIVKEYVNKTDTVVEHDTVKSEKETVVREASAADSAMLAKLGLQLSESQRIILVLRNELQERAHEKLESHTDTVDRVKEVQVPYPVPQKLTKWQQTGLNTVGPGAFTIVRKTWSIRLTSLLG